MKTRILIFVAFLALVPLLLMACDSTASIPQVTPVQPQPVVPVPQPAPSARPVFSSEEYQVIAEELVRMSETFIFDGIEESLKLSSVKAVAPSDSLVFTFEFQSRHAGYGDRTGEMLAQVITPHKVVITVAKDEITSAVMDGQRDILEGEA